MICKLGILHQPSKVVYTLELRIPKLWASNIESVNRGMKDAAINVSLLFAKTEWQIYMLNISFLLPLHLEFVFSGPGGGGITQILT